MLRVLYVFPEPLPLPRARGVQVAHTVHALAERCAEVTLAYVPVSGEDPFSAYGLKRPANVRLWPVSRSFPWPFCRMHSNRLFAIRLVRGLGRGQAAPDVIFVRHLKLAWLLLRSRLRCPMAYEAHEVFSETAPGHKRARLADMEKAVLEGAAVTIANSRATGERLRQRYHPAGEIPAIPNGVDYPEMSPEKDWAHCGQRIIYAGSFFGWKGVEDLVGAAEELPGCAIRLIGGTPQQVEKMRALASGKGARLDFAGMMSHDAVMTELKGACIGVLPNRPESDSAFTSPIKLFEYLAAGCAVVATELPPVREILGPEDAAWARPGAPASLAAAIRTLASDPARARALGEAGRARARSFTWSARGARLAEILEAIPRVGQ